MTLHGTGYAVILGKTLPAGTLKPWVYQELGPRSRMRYFQGAIQQAAEIALAAGTITHGNYVTINGLYAKPFRVGSTTGKQIDVMDQVRQDAVTSYGLAVNDWYASAVFTWLCGSTGMTAVLNSISTRLAALSGE